MNHVANRVFELAGTPWGSLRALVRSTRILRAEISAQSVFPTLPQRIRMGAGFRGDRNLPNCTPPGFEPGGLCKGQTPFWGFGSHAATTGVRDSFGMRACPLETSRRGLTRKARAAASATRGVFPTLRDYRARAEARHVGGTSMGSGLRERRFEVLLSRLRSPHLRLCRATRNPRVGPFHRSALLRWPRPMAPARGYKARIRSTRRASSRKPSGVSPPPCSVMTQSR